MLAENSIWVWQVVHSRYWYSICDLCHNTFWYLISFVVEITRVLARMQSWYKSSFFLWITMTLLVWFWAPLLKTCGYCRCFNDIFMSPRCFSSITLHKAPRWWTSWMLWPHCIVVPSYIARFGTLWIIGKQWTNASRVSDSSQLARRMDEHQ